MVRMTFVVRGKIWIKRIAMKQKVDCVRLGGGINTNISHTLQHFHRTCGFSFVL